MSDFDSKKDYLEVDQPLPGQSFCCLSFISPESIIQKRDLHNIELFLKSKGIDLTEYETYLEENEDMLEKSYSEKHNFQTTTRGLKVRGVFETLDEAKNRAQKVRASDPNFNVFVAPVGYWLPWDPSPDSIQNQEYMDKNLNELMYNYQKNREKSKQHFEEEVEERKRVTREQGQLGAQAAALENGAEEEKLQSLER